MAMVINTNALSLNAQNNLNKSQQSLNTAIERLSSGSRINSAKDDAAGLAISNRMNATVTGLNQANRNANDGVSLAQTAEGALGQVTDNLQRIRELTVQAKNDTNTADDRKSIQNEITERLGEIGRLSKQTQFNGKQLLGNSAEGANDFNSSISIQVGAKDNQTIQLDLQAMDVASLGMTGFELGDEVALDTADITTAVPTGGTYGDFSTDGEGNYYVEVSGSGDSDNDGLYSLNRNADGKMTATKADPQPTATLTTVTTANANATSGAFTGSVSTGLTSDDALATIDSALQRVDDARSKLGAQQNRLQSTIEGNSTTATNLSAAMSQIKDADYATEVSNMSKAQILQQAGTSVLAQANQTTQGVMSLLR